MRFSNWIARGRTRAWWTAPASSTSTSRFVRLLGPRSVVGLLAACALVMGAGCTKRARPAASAATVAAEPQPGGRGICSVPRHPNLANQPVRAHDWLSLMARLELGRGGVFATRDCLGRWINYAAMANACGSITYAQTQPRRMAVAEETVIVRDLGDTSYLVWVITHRFEDGDGYGPLALARRDSAGLWVEAMGVLRMHGERVKLERWNIQNETVVSVSGERCSQAQNGKRRCERSTQLLLQHGQQLMAAPVVDPQNRCLEQAQFPLARSHERPVGAGVMRTFELSSDITHDARYVVVEERLLVRDADTRSQSQPARVVQRVETRRLLQPYAGRLVTRQDSLWKRAVDSATRSPSAAHSGQRYD